MTTIEDRLRAATRAAAQTVAPDGAPPLRLPGDPLRGPGPRRPRRRRWAGWLAPLAAAAAVTAVIAGTLAISGAIDGHPPRHHSVPSGTVPPVPAGQIPPYYVALAFTASTPCCSRGGTLFSPRTDAVVRATRTGAVLATIAPPKPYGTFAGVAAAGDDRTFVLAAQPEGTLSRNFQVRRRTYPPATRFFLLRIDPAAPAGARARLTPLGIPPEPTGFALANFALSPSGTTLAVASNYGEIQVFNLVTGARRTWSASSLSSFPYGLAGATNAMLAWQGEHTLAFVWDGIPFSADGVRLLDTRAPGPNLLADSRLAQPKSVIGHDAYWRQILPTADGRTLITVLEVPGTKAFPHLGEEVTEFALRAGRVRIVNHISASGLQGDYETVLWASPSGRTLIVTGTRHVRHPPAQPFFISGARVLTPGHSRPIPWSNGTFAAAW